MNERVGTVPRPTLIGAVVAKAAACSLPDDPARHLRDLALLCALIDDPFAITAEIGRTDRRRLRCAAKLDDPNHRAWQLVPERLRDDGRVAWAILNEPPNPAARRPPPPGEASPRDDQPTAR